MPIQTLVLTCSRTAVEMSQQQVLQLSSRSGGTGGAVEREGAVERGAPRPAARNSARSALLSMVHAFIQLPTAVVVWLHFSPVAAFHIGPGAPHRRYLSPRMRCNSVHVSDNVRCCRVRRWCGVSDGCPYPSQAMYKNSGCFVGQQVCLRENLRNPRSKTPQLQLP